MLNLYPGGDTEDLPSTRPVQATTEASRDLQSYIPFIVKSGSRVRQREQSPGEETIRESGMVSVPFENTASSGEYVGLLPYKCHLLPLLSI